MNQNVVLGCTGSLASHMLIGITNPHYVWSCSLVLRDGWKYCA